MTVVSVGPTWPSEVMLYVHIDRLTGTAFPLMRAGPVDDFAVTVTPPVGSSSRAGSIRAAAIAKSRAVAPKNRSSRLPHIARKRVDAINGSSGKRGRTVALRDFVS